MVFLFGEWGMECEWASPRTLSPEADSRRRALGRQGEESGLTVGEHDGLAVLGHPPLDLSRTSG